MKPFYLFLITATIFLSCKKYNQEKELGQEIIGSWEIEHYHGWPVSLAYPPGNGMTITFSPGFVFENRLHDTLVSRGTYDLGFKKECQPEDHHLQIEMNRMGGSKSIGCIEIKEGKLNLSTPDCYQDGGTSVWRKL